ncbi:hypothetical protein KI387_018647, partial [Taxus chinensis]
MLIPPQDDHPFYLYLSTTDHAVGAKLAHRDSEHREQAVYYIIRTLVDYKTRYTHVENLCLALSFVATKLRHYLLNHKTFVITNLDPIHYMYTKPHLNQRIVRWLMLLANLDLEFVHQKSIKGQTIADQLVEAPLPGEQFTNFTFPDELIATLSLSEESYSMTLFFDGSKCQCGGGGGVVLIPLDAELIPLSFRLDFPYTNNTVEYEALVLGLQ